ncbi:hypothetical protein CEE37_07315 [candidate division LCP-89 bacterium B3_LCP]|uniref:DUF560 domain-containing protein n=1 Tax=candidate division LCP-89 bacterium B3_LCP TaxID=2012998 RepID=A0A532V0M4_UNCL8|nr:MAG: hypothetical protein CEE37_07315 [candidate division LCP-89 bacterium B3_LCP]
MNPCNRIILLISAITLIPASLFAGPLSIGNFTQVKLEYQYTDYLKYSYPNPILFEYPNQQYTQPLPYIVDFPENRSLARVTQGIGFNDEIQLKYQYSDLSENNFQDLFNLKYQRNVSASADVHISGQFTRGTGNFLGKMVQLGGRYDWAGFVLASASYAYYTNEIDSVGLEKSDAHSFQLKLRQTLSRSTAFQVRHDWFFASGEKADFVSNTLTFWLSQWLPTQTAVHLEWREHWDTAGLTSHSPSLEIAQYLSWATIFKTRARYYYGKPTDEAALETIKGDHFTSFSISGILSHHLFAETIVSVKYRYYWSDQDVEMNTYLLALEHIL